MTEMNPGQSVEDWRPVPTMPHIEASTLGRLRYIGPPRRRMQPGHIIPQQTDALGYKGAAIPLVGDGPARSQRHAVHRLVALAFHGLPPLSNQRIVVGHLDDDPGNNRPENLKWMTQRENCNAPGCKAKHLRNNSGSRHPFFGRKHSPETRAKMSAALMGNDHRKRRADG
ncbi:MAG: NUMOD3 domain-containing DNA-binding protein [Allorhizobium sp.]